MKALNLTIELLKNHPELFEISNDGWSIHTRTLNIVITAPPLMCFFFTIELKIDGTVYNLSLIDCVILYYHFRKFIKNYIPQIFKFINKINNMNIYKLTQNSNCKYDTYDSIIVAAVSEDDAKDIAPNNEPFKEYSYWVYWAKNKNDINVEFLGIANENIKRGVLLASFNAG